jgi:hypothetical protein
MATKRIPRQRGRRVTTLPGSMVDYLLTGDYMTVHESMAALGTDDTAYAPWAPLIEPAYQDLGAVWREHRAALLAEWKRRGGKGAPWAALEFDQVKNSGKE